MKMENVVVTGGAGFIGSHLIDRLLLDGCRVTCIDNLSLGSLKNIEHPLACPGFNFIQADLCQIDRVFPIFSEGHFDTVFHLAANSDIQKGGQKPDIDFMNTFITTRNVLEMMRLHEIKQIFFTSTSAVYGEKVDIALSEEISGLMPVSYYGGAKMASEALLSSYTFMNDFSTLIFRLPNVIGPRLTHDVIFDFIKKLRMNSKELVILGDGTQSKPYMYISDLIDAIIMMAKRTKNGFDIYNVGVETATSVKMIADIVTSVMHLDSVAYLYTGSDRGWKGDVPKFKYNLAKIRQTGWIPRYTSDEAVRQTVAAVLAQ